MLRRDDSAEGVGERPKTTPPDHTSAASEEGKGRVEGGEGLRGMGEGGGRGMWRAVGGEEWAVRTFERLVRACEEEGVRRVREKLSADSTKLELSALELRLRSRLSGIQGGLV